MKIAVYIPKDNDEFERYRKGNTLPFDLYPDCPILGIGNVKSIAIKKTNKLDIYSENFNAINFLNTVRHCINDVFHLSTDVLSSVVIFAHFGDINDIKGLKDCQNRIYNTMKISENYKAWRLFPISSILKNMSLLNLQAEAIKVPHTTEDLNALIAQIEEEYQ